jgi:assimilatory nitrate reductase catalytic subunit
MGGREVGGLATTLAAHRDLDNAAHRAEMARLWGVERVPSAPGLTAVELFDALASGRVKIVWIACTNPPSRCPTRPGCVRRWKPRSSSCFRRPTRIPRQRPFADVLLPATSWGEKEGTVTNSERRISRVRAALPKPFEARHDWEIACAFAARFGDRPLFPLAGKSGLSPNPEIIWNEHREATRGRDLDITGLSYAILEQKVRSNGPTRRRDRGTRTPLRGRTLRTPDGRARFFAERHRPVAEPVDARFPLALTTGRLRDQWHGMSRTATSQASSEARRSRAWQ